MGIGEWWKNEHRERVRRKEEAEKSHFNFGKQTENIRRLENCSRKDHSVPPDHIKRDTYFG